MDVTHIPKGGHRFVRAIIPTFLPAIFCFISTTNIITVSIIYVVTFIVTISLLFLFPISSSQADHCPNTTAPTPSPAVDGSPPNPQIDASSVVPTSLMKYVLFLSAHLDSPVSSLEQNGKTGRQQYSVGHTV